MTKIAVTRTEKIAALNDVCRRGEDPKSRWVATAAAVAAVCPGIGPISTNIGQRKLAAAVRDHVFPPDDRSERDVGFTEIDGHRVMFKIDYYDNDLEFASEDPADPAETVRVLTVMLPSDY